MTNGLEVFNTLLREYIADEYDITPYESGMIDIVEKELGRLKEIDNANPSEALECLDYIGRFKFDTDTLVCNMNSFHIIEQALIKAQEQEKVFEIINNKRVDFDVLLNCNFVHEYNNAMDYTYPGIGKDFFLTQEEFDLLKRHCKNE